MRILDDPSTDCFEASFRVRTNEYLNTWTSSEAPRNLYYIPLEIHTKGQVQVTTPSNPSISDLPTGSPCESVDKATATNQEARIVYLAGKSEVNRDRAASTPTKSSVREQRGGAQRAQRSRYHSPSFFLPVAPVTMYFPLLVSRANNARNRLGGEGWSERKHTEGKYRPSLHPFPRPRCRGEIRAKWRCSGRGRGRESRQQGRIN